MADVGRPTDYKHEYCEQAEKLCKLGATDKELADFFDIAESTLYLWKSEHLEFSEALIAGKLLADANVAAALYQRAIGYSHPDTDIRAVAGEVVQTPITKHYPPDTAAAIMWLKNRQKAKWRDKIEHGITDNDGNDVVIFRIPDNGRDEHKDDSTTTGLPAKGAQ